MTMTISGSSGLIFPDGSGQETGIGRNRIINGAMVIDQRNAGASKTPVAYDYTLDRWACLLTQSSKFTVQQSSTAPTGFSFSAKITSSSAYSVTASDYFGYYQPIEGFNFSDMAWGTANAKTITLSFQVYSSLTGTFGGSLSNSAGNRSYPFTYTISTANTWTTISVTIAGDTSGTWVGATNGVGVYVVFSLGAGSTFSGTAGSWASSLYYSATGATSVVGTSGATFYITGVQLEISSTATPFERRLYNQELANCQRYYEKWNADNGGNYAPFASGQAYTTTHAIVSYKTSQTMRAIPTLGFGTTASLCLLSSANNVLTITGLAADSLGVSVIAVDATVASGLTAGNCTRIAKNAAASNGYVEMNAEL